MRKQGWQLPYHPLQVVAIAVFLALGFAFYVFFAPFMGTPFFQFILTGIYTPLMASVFGLYIWCAAADPADPGVFRSKKYLHFPDNKNNATESTHDHNTGNEKHNPSLCQSSWFPTIPGFLLCSSYLCYSCKNSADQQGSEEGMFYCSLCEVEVFTYSKHCRVCDKCVDCFDHHCRWINNCIGKRNYRTFFALMVFALLMLVLQWSTGIFVLIQCFVKKKQFEEDIASKLGSSFSVVPFAIVVAVCTFLAMVATLPLAQLFFFHVILIRKGISTYDYIVALREQEQEAAEGQNSPQMSTLSSITGLSSASSFNNFQRAAWCTPPRLFLDDQFDAIPPDNASVSSLGKRTAMEEPSKKKNAAPIKISPWALARLNAEDVSKAAAEARKNSKILRPTEKKHETASSLETKSTSLDSSSRRISLRPNDDSLPISEPVHRIATVEGNTGHAITEPAHTFRKSHTMRCSVRSSNYSSPESSLSSPEICPLNDASTSGAKSKRRNSLSRSNSNDYGESSGEDSDHGTRRILHRSANWRSLIHGSDTVQQYEPTSKRMEE
ncbi:probable protein S-acyltransferase 22 isoform X2 [Andrographis paniculata]|uniref:probable protein S-acyltransferase 22 isoform X2 n=1 Tax=Andrographis paniculata TaxID=175694 RepID=UPI0021E6F799|nr:probable protein S-acyltransferase 22 isoform X2 [Andrographis paniculata]